MIECVTEIAVVAVLPDPADSRYGPFPVPCISRFMQSDIRKKDA